MNKTPTIERTPQDVARFHADMERISKNRAASGSVIPKAEQWEKILGSLRNLRNDLDKITFDAKQEYREALYLLNECIEKMEDIVTATQE